MPSDPRPLSHPARQTQTLSKVRPPVTHPLGHGYRRCWPAFSGPDCPDSFSPPPASGPGLAGLGRMLMVTTSRTVPLILAGPTFGEQATNAFRHAPKRASNNSRCLHSTLFLCAPCLCGKSSDPLVADDGGADGGGHGCTHPGGKLAGFSFGRCFWSASKPLSVIFVPRKPKRSSFLSSFS
jgi:hypothetical protein